MDVTDSKRRPSVAKGRAARRPLTGAQLALTSVGVTIVAGSLVVFLWTVGTKGLNGSELVSARFEALKIGLSIAISGGGIFALYLAWRRQRSTEDDVDNRERALEHQRQVADTNKVHQDRLAEDSRNDAVDRRITELYVKAIDQIGSDKAPVRLGGLYALERLAEGNPEQRQMIVNVICAYLRTPFASVSRESERIKPRRRPNRIVPVSTKLSGKLREELEVRLGAQRILQAHLRPMTDEAGEPAENARFWQDTDLDLTGADVVDLDLSTCSIRNARFNGAQIRGKSNFGHARFRGSAQFVNCTIADEVDFQGAQFEADVRFDYAQFSDKVRFYSVHVNRQRNDDNCFPVGWGFRKALKPLGKRDRFGPPVMVRIEKLDP